MVIMAGMLPGVEHARRRRLGRQGCSSSTDSPCCSRGRSCAHTCGCEAHNMSNVKRSSLNKELHGWILEDNAREAKERLDQKLRSQRESMIKRHHSMGSIRLFNKNSSTGAGNVEGAAAACPSVLGNLQREVFSKKSAARRFSWGKLGWRGAQEQVECAVCLDEFKTGDILVNLPCEHRFHWSCAVPWFEGSSRCPFCRSAISNPSS